MGGLAKVKAWYSVRKRCEAGCQEVGGQKGPASITGRIERVHHILRGHGGRDAKSVLGKIGHRAVPLFRIGGCAYTEGNR